MEIIVLPTADVAVRAAAIVTEALGNARAGEAKASGTLGLATG